MASVICSRANLVRRLLPTVTRRLISTSKKNSDTAAAAVATKSDTATTTATNKNWISYGFDLKDEATDRNATHSIFFMTITVCLVIGGFVLAYLPDYNLRDWAQREAFLELKRREAEGLPLIDANLIDPAKIQLPSDEELGDIEIII